MASTPGQPGAGEHLSSSSFDSSQTENLQETAFRLFTSEEMISINIQSLSDWIPEEAMAIVKREFQKRDDDFEKIEDLLRYSRYIADSTNKIEYLVELLNFTCDFLIHKDHVLNQFKVIDGFALSAEILCNFFGKIPLFPGYEDCAGRVFSTLTYMRRNFSDFLATFGPQVHVDKLMKLLLCKSMLHCCVFEFNECKANIKEAIELFNGGRPYANSKLVYSEILYYKALREKRPERISIVKESIKNVLEILRQKPSEDSTIAGSYDILHRIATDGKLTYIRALPSYLLERVKRRNIDQRKDFSTEDILIYLIKGLLYHSLGEKEELKRVLRSMESENFPAPSIVFHSIALELTLTVLERKLTANKPDVHRRLVTYAKDICLQFGSHNIYKKYLNLSRLIDKILFIPQYTLPTFDECVYETLNIYVYEIKKLVIIPNCSWMIERCSHAYLYLSYLSAQAKQYDKCCELAKDILCFSNIFVQTNVHMWDELKATAHYLIAFSLFNCNKSFKDAIEHSHQAIFFLQSKQVTYSVQLKNLHNFSKRLEKILKSEVTLSSKAFLPGFHAVVPIFRVRVMS